MIRSFVTRRDGRRDTGTSLVELLVTMVVFALLGTAMTLFVNSVARQSTTAKQRLTATQQAQTAIDHISRELRAASPLSTTPASAFTLASTTHVTFASSLGASTGPSLVDLTLTGGQLQEKVTKADAASHYTWTGTPTTRLLAAVGTGSTSLFTYYDKNNNVLASPMSTATATNAIDHILITLVVQQSNLGGPVTVTSMIYPRDLEYTS